MSRSYDQIRVLVTGGAGFIGSHLCEALLGSGHEVVALDDLSRGHAANLRALVDHERFTMVHGNVTDGDLVSRLAQGCQTIYHLAASVGNPTNPRLDLEVNVVGTFDVLEAAHRSDPRPAVVYASSNKVYADHVNRIRLSEERTRYVIDEPRFLHGIPEGFGVDQGRHNMYGLSKLAAELFVQDYAHLYGIRTGVFRQSTIYGPRDSGGWMGRVMRSTVEGRPIKVYGNGKQLRDVLYVTDLVNAYRAFVSSGVPSGVWNVGGGPEFTLSVLELVDWLERLTGKRPEVIHEPATEGDQKVFYSDIRKLQKDLGWRPAVTPEAGIRQTVEWLEREGRGN